MRDIVTAFQLVNSGLSKRQNIDKILLDLSRRMNIYEQAQTKVIDSGFEAQGFLIENLVIRITSLEKQLASQQGTLELGIKVNEENFLNSAFTAISSNTLYNQRIERLEKQMSMVGRLLLKTSGEIDLLEEQIQTLTHSMLQQIDFDYSIYNRVSSLIRSVNGLVIERDLQTKFEDTSTIFDLVRKGFSGVTELLKFLGPEFSVLLDLNDKMFNAALSQIQNSYDDRNTQVIDTVGAFTTELRLLNNMMAEVATVKSSLLGPMFSTINMKKMLETVNLVRGLNLETATDVEDGPTVALFLIPLSFNIVKLLSTGAIEFVKRFGLQDAAFWSNKFPAHALVVITYPIDATTRRQILVETGDATPEEYIHILTGGTANRNFIHFNDNIQRLSNGVWSSNKKVTYGNLIEEDLGRSTLSQVMMLQRSYNLTLKYIELMIEFEPNYNLFTNNCQDVATKIMNFLTVGQTPGWWTPSCSARTLIAEMSNEFGQIEDVLMQPTYESSDNHLTMTAVPSGLNMLTEIRNQYEAIKPGVIDDLLSIV